jgi:hypothetical protein
MLRFFLWQIEVLLMQYFLSYELANVIMVQKCRLTINTIKYSSFLDSVLCASYITSFTCVAPALGPSKDQKSEHIIIFFIFF